VAARSVREVGAQAYTVGQHIVTPDYAPGTAAGRHLLAHEMMHTLQQGKRTPSARMPVLGADHASEREAGRGVKSVFTGVKPQITPVAQPAIQRTLFPIIINPTERRRVYSGTASPGPGLSISWSGSAVSIRARMEISGAEATAALAAQIKATIERYWNASFPDGYRVSCTADVRYRASGASADPGATQIEIVRAARDSFVQRYWLVGQRYMTFNLNNGINWTPAHEFGHLLGLDDRYAEGIVSRVSGIFGGRREATVEAGWSGNIMAEVNGSVESKNVMDLLSLYAYIDVPVPLLGPNPSELTA
jgi:hypothetical protein